MIDVPVEVKEALKEGQLRKNYVIDVLNDDDTIDFTIDNDYLVAESVDIDERMDSGDDIKFGLCEGASLEFQYFDKPNIYNRRLKVTLEVEYPQSNNFYPIPMGYFTVKKCSRASSTGIMKVTAYNKLQSDYLDRKANSDIITIAQESVLGAPDEVNIGVILDELLGEYAIKRSEYIPDGNKSIYGVTPATSTNPRYQFYERTGNTYISTGLYLHIISKEVRFSPDDYNVNNVYRLVMDCKTLQDAVTSYQNQVLESYQNYYLKDRVTSEYIKVSEFAESAVGFLSAGDGIYYIDGEIYTKDYPSSRQVKGKWTIQTKDYGFRILVPVWFWVDASSHTWQQQELTYANDRINELILNNDNNWYYEESAQSGLEKIRLTLDDVKALPDVTLRELQSAVYESQCQYGQLDRITDLFYGAELNRSRLYPTDDLYPDSALYPSGAQSSPRKASYRQLFADDGNIRRWRYLKITYKTLNENDEEVDEVLQRTVDEHGTDDYDMSDNWLFRNLIWTAAEVEAYAETMKSKMQDITWFPFEMDSVGLPYLEVGDEIEININNNSYTSYILQRVLSGIQNLEDNYINGTLDTF